MPFAMEPSVKSSTLMRLQQSAHNFNCSGPYQIQGMALTGVNCQKKLCRTRE